MSFEMFPITIVAIVGFVYTWALTLQEIRASKEWEWPHTIALVGAAAATLQVPLPFLMALFFVDPHDQKDLALSAGLEVLLFMVALPCAFRRKGLLRWFLALSSVFFLALTGFVYAISQWQF
jgi:hypothetical protein